jgi:hypothetical protein
MSTTWTITASDIIRGALEVNSAIGATETVTAEDSELCLRALNGIIKEMPLHGLSWPQLSSSAVAVTWSIVTPGKVTPPTDYFGVPVLKYTTASGPLKALDQLSKPAFELLDLTKTAAYPTHFYEAPDKTFYLWPVPTQDPVLKLSYQAIADDASLTVTPDVQQQYLNLFELWVGDKVSLKFETSAQTRAEINARFKEALERMKQWAVDMAPISFEVVG